MPNPVLSFAAQYRYDQALKCMDQIMDPTTINDAYRTRDLMNNLLRHLCFAEVSVGTFMEVYFQTKQVSEPIEPVAKAEFKCTCNKVFKNSHALSGHKRTCKK